MKRPSTPMEDMKDMAGADDPRITKEQLSCRVQELEKQLDTLLGAELDRRDLQARLDRQVRTQAHLVRLSEQLHHCRQEHEVAKVVAESLVQCLRFHRAVVGIYDRAGGKPAFIALDGYPPDKETAIREAASLVLLAPRPDEEDIQVRTGSPLAELRLEESVFIVCRSSTGEPLGCVAFGVGKDRPRHVRRIEASDRPLWEAVASVTSNALENAKVYQQLTREREDLKRAYDHLRSLNESLERTVSDRTRELARSEGKYRSLYLESNQTSHMYRTLLDASPDPIVVYDIEGRPTYVNPAFTRVFGWTLDEVKGRPIAFVPSENRPETEEMIRKVLDGVHFSNQETRRYTKDGTVLDVSVSAAIYFDQAGKAAGSITHIRDVTERKKLEEHLLKVVKLEAVGLLAGGIAHDFNNILAGILMNVQLAERILDKTDRAVLRYLTGIERATERASALTHQLLTFAKGGAPARRSASIAQLIRDSAGFVLRGSNVRSEFDLPRDLLPVDMDQGQMSQVINNLIINAYQAMPGGGVVRVKAENVFLTEDQLGPDNPLGPGRYVRVSIQDQGCGIPEENLKRIFDPYFSTKDKGSGLGLAITFSIVNRHHGYIAVDSVVGKGSTFSVYLPASDPATCAAGADEHVESLEVGRGRILVMDDEEVLRVLAQDLLGSIGYQVQTAESGEEAILLYTEASERGNGFDVVVMDLTVPGGMGGKDAIRRLREIDPGVKAIVCSGYSNDPIMADYEGFGFKGVVHKPYRAEELTKEISRVMTGSYREAQDRQDPPLNPHAGSRQSC